MKLLKICLFTAFSIILAVSNLNAQMISQKSDSQYTVEIPCTGERVVGTLYFHNISQLDELTGYSKYFSNIHSSELVCNENGNVYRLAGCTEDRKTSGNSTSYYGVWHFVGKKGNQVRIIITTPPKTIGEFGSPESLSFQVDCNQ